jgi:hypothetical protein
MLKLEPIKPSSMTELAVPSSLILGLRAIYLRNTCAMRELIGVRPGYSHDLQRCAARYATDYSEVIRTTAPAP